MALDRLTKVDGGGISTTSDYRVGIITASKFVGPIEGTITATDGTFSGNVTIGGTLTYEDVTNIDSVGIITAQKDIHVGAGVSVVGVGTFNSDIHLGQFVVHKGDTTTHFGFDVPNQIEFTAGNNERLRITNTGNVHFAGDQSGVNRGIIYNGPGYFGLFGSSSGSTKREIRFHSSSSGNDETLRISTGGNVAIYKDLDVDGHTNLDNVSIAGVATVYGTSSYDILQLRAQDNNGIANLNIYANGTTGHSRILFSDTAASSGDGYINYSHTDRALTFTTAGTNNERLRITSGGDVTTTGTSTFSRQNAGFTARAGDAVSITRASGTPLEINRTGSDGQMISLFDDNTQEAAISLDGGSLVFGLPNSSDPHLEITSAGILKQFASGGDNQFVTKRTGSTYSNGDYFFHLSANNSGDTTVGNLGFYRETANDDARFAIKTKESGGNNSERFRIDSLGRASFSKNGWTGNDMSFALTVHTGSTSDGGNNNAVNDGIMIVSQNNNGNQNSTTGKLMFCGHGQTNGPFLYGKNAQAYGKKDLVINTHSTANSYSTQLEETARFTYYGALRVDKIEPRDGLDTNAFGGVIQVKWSANVDNANYSSSSDVAMQTVAITPTRNDARILIHVCYPSIRSFTTGNTRNRLNHHITRDGSEIYSLPEMPQWRGANFNNSGVEINSNVAFTHIDSPSTTSEVTYRATWQSADSQTWNTASAQMVMICVELTGY